MLLTPTERAAVVERRERLADLEARAKRGEVNPDEIADAPTLLTGSMIGG